MTEFPGWFIIVFALSLIYAGYAGVQWVTTLASCDNGAVVEQVNPVRPFACIPTQK